MIQKERVEFLKQQEQQRIIDAQIKNSLNQIDKTINEEGTISSEIPKKKIEEQNLISETSKKEKTEVINKKIPNLSNLPNQKKEKKKPKELIEEIIIKKLNTNNQINIDQDFSKIKRLKIIKEPVFIFKLPGLKMTNYLKYPYKEYSNPILKKIPTEKEVIDLIFKVKLENYQAYVNNAYKNSRKKEIEIIIGKNKLIMDPLTEEIQNTGEMNIPEDVKKMFLENSAIYYLYLYLSVKNGALFLDHEFEQGFSIEDSLLYIYVKLWGNEPENEI